MKRTGVLLLVVCSFGGVAATEPPALVNYQGVLRDSTDHPLDGTYGMVFRFFTAETGGDEILVDRHAAVSVSRGLFSVKLGGGTVSDGSGPGTYTSLARAFRDYPGIYLEVEVAGETLAPRTQVLSAGFALNTQYVKGRDLVWDGPLDLYVDGTAGDDSSDCLSIDTPCATIQAAVDRIPTVVAGDVTVHIADGAYHEEVFIGGLLHGPHYMNLVGNEMSPELVSLDGNTDGPQNLDRGITILDPLVNVSGLQVSGFRVGIAVAFGGHIWVTNTRVVNNSDVGISVRQAAAELHAGVSIIGNPNLGLESAFNSDLALVEVPCSILDSDMIASEHSTIRGYAKCVTTGSACLESDTSARCVP